jgi:hypothetical protein
MLEKFQSLMDDSSRKIVKNYKKQALKTARQQIPDNFQEVFTFKDGQFGTTFRHNGDVVQGNTRDTIDTGDLRNGLKFEWRSNTLYVTSDVDYLPYVLYGFVTRGGRLIPPRVLELLDLGEI